ncbi:two-component system sensor histidine kinase NtrB [Alkalihalobacterium chitinilyticum]|uniref:histidine kinase n=1 Tax=Alkalihalobacterium chitinilyticum TaxID=2980103 RepID=A0ABT5VDL2_9BACI|nr:ATP-binding protein [Alkalihalobacterium chitinilyticum]MDE5413545.1 ATP-binding protein [Alkalihalobacterium chitinilyticum]
MNEVDDKERRLDAFIDNLQDPFFILNEYGECKYLNKATERLFVTSKESLTNKVIWKEARALAHTPLYIKFQEVIKTGENVQFELLCERTLKWFNVEISTSENEYAIQFHDITFTKKVLEKTIQKYNSLFEAQQLHIQSEKLSFISELAAGIAHEINNPLTTIKGFLQLWKEGSIHYPDHYSIFESELERIALISNELLTLGKPLSQQVKLHDISTILRETTEIFQQDAQKRNIQIFCNTKESTCFVLCNEAQMKQVFFNIIENGIDAMDDGGKMIVDTSISDQNVVVSISDDGKGIPSEILNKIGEPFYTTKEKGTGLGLMVCYGIVKQYNGEIFVSTKVGTGTTFTIKLPLVDMS